MGRAWLVACSFAVGIAMMERALSPAVLGVVGIASAMGVALRPAIVRLVVILVVAAGAGSFIATLHARRAEPVRLLASTYPRCDLEGVISQRSGIGTFVRVRSLRCPEPLPAGAEVLVDATGELGGIVRAHGLLTPLGRAGIDAVRARAGAAAAFRSLRVRTGPPETHLHASAAAVRKSLRSATRGRPAETAGLLRGLAIGETDLIAADDAVLLRNAGLTHLVAVSGTNVTIVLTAVAATIGRASRRVRLCVCATALAFFVVIVGPEPSVLRAAAMGAVGLVALTAGTRTDPLNALALAVVGVLAIRPPMVHALGLHLSVAATAGICLWAASIEGWIGIGPRWLRAATAVTVAAQLAVAPLLVGAFGEVSIAGLPANVLAAPAVAPATVLALAAAIVGLVWMTGAEALIALAAPCADWIILIGRAFGGADAATVGVPRWGAWALAAGFCCLVARRAWFAGRSMEPA